MAVIIATTSKVADKFGAGVHGFTNGDPQSGTKPTVVDSDWHDAAQQETNNAIEHAGIALDGADVDQLAEAIERMIAQHYPRGLYSGNHIFRTQSQPDISATEEAWHEWRKTRALAAKASGTNQTVGIFQMPASDVVWQLETRVSIVDTSDTTLYGNVCKWVSGYYTGGTLTISIDSDLFSDMTAIAGLTATAVAYTFSEIGVQIALPALPAGRFYNIFSKSVFTFTTR